MEKTLSLSILFLWVVPVVSGLNETSVLCLPNGFYQEGGAGATSIAVGSKNGRFIAAYLSEDKFYFFNQDTMHDDPWIVHTPIRYDGKTLGCFKKISMTNDGAVFALGADTTTLYQYTWPRAEMPVTMKYGKDKKEGRWATVACQDQSVQFKHIATGNDKQVWALAENGAVYRLEDGVLKRFQLKDGLTCSWLSVGLDGTVVFITPQAKSYVFKDDTWFRFSAAPALNKIAVATKRLMWGLSHNGPDGSCKLWRFDCGRWSEVKSKNSTALQRFEELALNAAGSVFAIDADGHIFANGERGVPIKFVQSMVRLK